MGSNTTESPRAATANLNALRMSDMESPIWEIKALLFMLQDMWDGIPREKSKRCPNDRLLICSNDRFDAIGFTILEAQDRAKAIFHMWDELASNDIGSAS